MKILLVFFQENIPINDFQKKQNKQTNKQTHLHYFFLQMVKIVQKIKKKKYSR